jgi:ParB/RepB/Spo0J family partition protein
MANKRTTAVEQGIDASITALMSAQTGQAAEQKEGRTGPPGNAASGEGQAQAPPTSAIPPLDKLLKHVGGQVMLYLDWIELAENVRQEVDFEDPSYAELVDSIKETGLLQNLLVGLLVQEGNYRLVCVGGQRRYHAARRAGVEKVPAILRRYDSLQAMVADGLAENLTRKGLHPLDVADGYWKLIQEGWTKERIQERFSRGQATVDRLLSLAKYPMAAKRLIRRHPEVFNTKVLFNEFAARSWSDEPGLLAALEAKASQGVDKRIKPRGKAAQNDFEKSFYRRLSEPGITLKVKGTEEKGRLSVTWEYNSRDELERLISSLKGKATSL